MVELRRIAAALICAVGAGGSVAFAQDEPPDFDSRRRHVPDLRDAEVPATAQKGNFVFAPIPFSNPTLDTGLILGVAYFYPQSAQQAQTQPASVTGLGAMYSENGSSGGAIGHSGYLREDRWRVSGAYGEADLELPLLSIGESAELATLDWLLDATLFYAEFSRRIAPSWYFGMSVLNVDVDQDFQLDIQSLEFDLLDSFTSTGAGINLTYDTRDLPTNAYEGRYFKASSLLNRDALGSDLDYDAYSLEYRSYHALTDSLVLAWQLKACSRSDGVPLWDACKIGLRGFASTDYMGKESLIGQAEARWRFAKRWGIVAFAGAGKIEQSLSGLNEGEWVPSYGAGVRFMIQQAKRINLRLDYAESKDSDSVSFFVGESF